MVSTYLAVADSSGNNWAIQLTQDCSLAARELQKAADVSTQDAGDMAFDEIDETGINLGGLICIGENDGRVVSQSKWVLLEENLVSDISIQLNHLAY